MFLLIREKKKEDFRYYPPLNSIMFLLIQMFLPFEDEAAETLNSIMFLLILLADLEYHLVRQIFKFHYVSINSAPVHPSLLCPKSLNSIMFLLIQGKSLCYNVLVPSLNSIMFLLIRL